MMFTMTLGADAGQVIVGDSPDFLLHRLAALLLVPLLVLVGWM